MIELSTSALLMLGLSVLVSAVAYLLRQKDAQQEQSIKLLFKKHDEDAARLDAFQLEIAREHYVKAELDSKFDRLEQTTREGFISVSSEIKLMTKALLDHVNREDDREERRLKAQLDRPRT